MCATSLHEPAGRSVYSRLGRYSGYSPHGARRASAGWLQPDCHAQGRHARTHAHTPARTSALRHTHTTRTCRHMHAHTHTCTHMHTHAHSTPTHMHTRCTCTRTRARTHCTGSHAHAHVFAVAVRRSCLLFVCLMDCFVFGQSNRCPIERSAHARVCARSGAYEGVPCARAHTRVFVHVCVRACI